ncbi:MAG TPA: trypsin-like peptidase domain-containing protein [Erysipelothrix sp.]|nr:trypsin-like peptidase domain-containing protein [Erysipelothrix sp.]
MKIVKKIGNVFLTTTLSVVMMLGLIKLDVILIEPEVKEIKTTTVAKNNNTELQDIAQNLIPSVVTIQSNQSEGSGVVLDDEGHIITNEHVISNSQSINVVSYDGETLKAEVIGVDEQSDLALLKVKANVLEPATFGKSEDVRVADQVLAIGNPGGLQFSSTVTVGHVSAVNRVVNSANTSISFIQTDTTINPGNSGGALVNTNGEVIGINTSKIIADGYEGMGFSIPIDYVLTIMEDIQENGYVKNRATIGISAQYISEDEAKLYNIQSGIYVHEVISDKAKKELKEKDIITEYEGEKIESLAHLSQLLRNNKPNDKVKLKVYRDHKLKEITITLSENS